MMRDSSSLQTVIRPLAFLAVLLVFSATGVAQTYLAVELGFEGRLTPGHYAPIQIDVHNYQEVEASRLRIVQLAGNEWRGEATLQQELDYAIQSSGRYEAVIPIYDPVNPIIIELLSATDTVLATVTVDLRATMRPMPYPVLDKQLPRFDARAAVIDTQSLPTDWWALDSAESLWVASPLPSETWTAISQWVLAGGSLVIVTGTNFYRMDSPILRRLLPVSNPEIVMTDLGTSYLAGSYAATTIDMISNEQFPLLLHSRYGAGNISLVTVQPQSLSVEDLQLMSTYVPLSQLITLREPTESILGAQTVVALNSLLVLGMIALLCVIVCVCSVVGRRKPRIGWVLFLASMLTITVSSGFASNPATHAVDTYTICSSLYVQDVVSFVTVSSSIYSTTSKPLIQSHKVEILPLHFLPRTLAGTTSFDNLAAVGETSQQVADGTMRSWHAYGAAASTFELEMLSDLVVRIANFHPTDFDTGWMIIDGIVYPLADVTRGTADYALDPASSVRLATFMADGYSQHASPTLRYIREVRDVFPLSKGVWLIAAADDERLLTGELAQKVRDITLVVVHGEEANHEI